jgi:hypothetical protein
MNFDMDSKHKRDLGILSRVVMKISGIDHTSEATEAASEIQSGGGVERKNRSQRGVERRRRGEGGGQKGGREGRGILVLEFQDSKIMMKSICNNDRVV